MRTIIDKLADTFKALPIEKGKKHPLPFVYEDADVQNMVFDRIEPPFVACVPITSAAILDARNMYHERITLALWFADRMCENVPEYDAIANERIIDACKRRAFAWCASMFPKKDLELVSINSSERAYLESDAMLTGYMLNVTLEEVEGIGVCNAL